MSNLYEIDRRLSALEDLNVDIETGEYLSDGDFEKLFDEIKMELNDKIENTMCFVKDLIADSDKIKKECLALDKRAKQKTALANRLKSRIDWYIKTKYTDDDGNIDFESLNKYVFETPRLKISYNKSEFVDVFDVEKLPEEFINVKTTKTPNKVELKKFLKTGELEGAKLERNYNIQLK